MPSSSVLAQRQTLFVDSFLPVIAKRLDFRFRSLTPEARGEAVQDATASAWACFCRVAVAGKAWDGGDADRCGRATPSGIAAFTASHYVAGRRFLGSCTTDPLAPACQYAGRACVQSINHSPCGGEAMPAVMAAPHTNPATCVRIREDWQAIAARCSSRARAVLTLLVAGWKPQEIARRLRISASRVTQLKRDIAAVATSLGYGVAC